jgi:branched-chain amino acid transport system permease protein
VYAFSKGSISPDVSAIPRSVDALVMVLLGGVNTLLGPVVGAAVFTWLHDTLARSTDYWRALLGAIVLLIVMVFPRGIVGSVQALWAKRVAPSPAARDQPPGAGRNEVAVPTEGRNEPKGSQRVGVRAVE